MEVPAAGKFVVSKVFCLKTREFSEPLRLEIKISFVDSWIMRLEVPFGGKLAAVPGYFENKKTYDQER